MNKSTLKNRTGHERNIRRFIPGFIIIAMLLFIISCKVPKIIQTDAKNYQIVQWDGGTFAHIVYHWNGGDFSDAVEIGKKFNDLALKRGLDEQHLGMFPQGKTWYIGILLKGDFAQTEFENRAIEKTEVKPGTYAVMKLKGYPERMFLYYSKFKKMLENDGYTVESAVYEVWNPETFNNTNLPEKERTGEIRYLVTKK